MGIVFSLGIINAATEEYNLDRECPYTCRQNGEALTYRELLEGALHQVSNQVVKDLFNKAINCFSKPVDQSTVLNFTQHERESLLECKKSVCAISLDSPFCKNKEGKKYVYETGEFDLDFALTILSVNSYRYLGSNS